MTRRGACLLGLLLVGASCSGAGDDGDVWNSGDGTTQASTDAGDPPADSTGGTTEGTAGGTTSSLDGESTDGGIKLDVGPPGGGGIGCGCEAAYIWVANSPAGTVSKTDTSAA